MTNDEYVLFGVVPAQNYAIPCTAVFLLIFQNARTTKHVVTKREKKIIKVLKFQIKVNFKNKRFIDKGHKQST